MIDYMFTGRDQTHPAEKGDTAINAEEQAIHLSTLHISQVLPTHSANMWDNTGMLVLEVAKGQLDTHEFPNTGPSQQK
jgi:hypothetical protein